MPFALEVRYAYLDERTPELSSPVRVFVDLSQTFWLQAGARLEAQHGPGRYATWLQRGQREGEFSRVTQSSRKGLRGFVHI